MTKPSYLFLIAALLGAAACPAAAQTYAAGHVTATPLPPPYAPKPQQAAGTGPASDPQAEAEPNAAATSVAAVN